MGPPPIPWSRGHWHSHCVLVHRSHGGGPAVDQPHPQPGGGLAPHPRREEGGGGVQMEQRDSRERPDVEENQIRRKESQALSIFVLMNM